jgi:hypothetical protein
MFDHQINGWKIGKLCENGTRFLFIFDLNQNVWKGRHKWGKLAADGRIIQEGS